MVKVPSFWFFWPLALREARTRVIPRLGTGMNVARPSQLSAHEAFVCISGKIRGQEGVKKLAHEDLRWLGRVGVGGAGSSRREWTGEEESPPGGFFVTRLFT